MTSFLAELRRRNVIRVAGLYLVAAWLVVQVAETVLPVFETPGWVLKTLIVLLALGFVPVLVFSWAFELTPEGLKREAEVDRSASIVDRTARKLDVAVIVLLLAVGGLMLWQSTRPAPAGVAAAAGVPAAAASGASAAGTADPIAPVAEAAPAAPPAASIAVLPFVNMSADAENGYFADGISEELLNVLARIDGLTVASRTSSFSFKGETDKSIPEIARALGVRHVLEGSVRKQGQRVRITAQLIRAGTDSHLWSQTWDRDLTDIFEVQQEIAQAIADEMTELLPVAATVDVPVATRDMAAYEAMLRGRTRFYLRTELPEALADLEDAVARDPAFGEAWLYLAAVNFALPGYEPGADVDAYYAATDRALAEAKRRLPGHPLGEAIAGMLAYQRDDMAAGLETLARAAARPSPDSTPQLWYGLNLLRAGYVRDAVGVLAAAERADPLVGVNIGYHAIAQLSLDGDLDAAETRALRAAERQWYACAQVVAIEAQRRGDSARARRLLAAIPGSDNEFRRDIRLFEASLGSRTLPPGFVDALSPTSFGETLLAFSAYDELFALMDTRLALRAGEWNWLLRSAWLPSTRGFREDPRFYAAATDQGLVAAWEARGWPDGCVRSETASGEPRLACAEHPAVRQGAVATN